MDFGTISKRLQKGKYADPAQMRADVQLVFSNCRQFNDETAPVIAACANVEAAFKKHWKSAGMYQSAGAAAGTAAAARAGEVPGGAGQAAGAAGGADGERGGGGGGGKHRGPFDWKGAARGVMFRVQLQKCARWFMEPVDAQEVPDYGEIVKQVRWCYLCFLNLINVDIVIFC